MINSLELGIRVIIPLIVFMGVGYLFKRMHIAREQTFYELNKICFRCFLPIMIFYNIYQSDLKADFTPSVLAYAIVSVFAVFFATVILICCCFRSSLNRSVIIQGIYRSNFVLFGMEVTRTICGENQMGMASILVAVVIPIFNVLAVILFECFGSQKKSKLAVLKGIAKNPLIIASVAGILVKYSGFSFVPTVDSILTTMSKIATPLALMCLGGTFSFQKVQNYRRELLYVCLGRLVIVPLIFVSIAVFLGYRDSNLVALMVMYSSPTAVSSFSMAGEMGGNGELAGMIVVFTSIFSILTIFLWVCVLNAFSFI